MSLVIWQPYFFPYIGYFQAVSNVNHFCFFDDVQFIKKGFIHRNSIMVQGKPHRFTIPLKKASQNKKILEITVADDFTTWKNDFLKLLSFNYAQAPFHKKTIELVRASLESSDHISSIAENSVKVTAEYLGVETKFSRASDLDYDRSSRAADKMIQLCKSHACEALFNPSGGRELYQPSEFFKHGIELKFFQIDVDRLKKDLPSSDFSLSILHFLFHYEPEEIKSALNNWLVQ